MYDIMHMHVLVHVMSGSQAKVVSLPPLFSPEKHFFVQHFHSTQQVSWVSIVWFIDM